MIEATAVEVLSGLQVLVYFSDGTRRQVDLDALIPNTGAYRELRENRSLFESVSVVDGALTWPNEVDIDPAVLHGDEIPAWMDPGDGKESAAPSHALRFIGRQIKKE